VRILAGVTMTRAAMFSANLGLGGMEFAHGIPGTVGGGVYMNAGAYGGEMKDIVESVEIMDLAGNIRTLTKEEMAWIDDFARNYGLDKEMIAEIQTKLFDYKRFFSETEVAKELTSEESAQLTAFLEELGVRAEKVYPEVERQWIEYKNQLIKAASGGDGGR
jgi:UDP-N-acetylenolpyruvoylglucosamine reductase